MSVIALAPHSRGFTLLELMVSLVAASLLLGLLAESLGGLATTNRQLVAEIREQQGMATSIRLVGQLLKSITPPHPLDTASSFAGTSDEATFVTSPSEGIHGEGALRIRLFQEIEPSGEITLFADATPLLASDRSAGASLKRHRLITRLRSATFRYYEDADDGMRVSDRWSDATKLPALIQIVVATADGKQPLTISAAPRKHVSSRCRFDNIGLTCR